MKVLLLSRESNYSFLFFFFLLFTSGTLKINLPQLIQCNNFLFSLGGLWQLESYGELWFQAVRAKPCSSGYFSQPAEQGSIFMSPCFFLPERRLAGWTWLSCLHINSPGSTSNQSSQHPERPILYLQEQRVSAPSTVAQSGDAYWKRKWPWIRMAHNLFISFFWYTVFFPFTLGTKMMVVAASTKLHSKEPFDNTAAPTYPLPSFKTVPLPLSGEPKGRAESGVHGPGICLQGPERFHVNI